MKRILSVTVHREVDSDPDLSWLGEYSDKPKNNAIDRQERGEMQRGEFRYFNPAISGEESGNPDSPEEDYRRYEAYNKSQWWMIGVWCSAKVVLTDVVQTIRSGGLWGIESDSEDDYFEEVIKEELAALRGQLKAIGFSDRAISKAFKEKKEAT